MMTNWTFLEPKIHFLTILERFPWFSIFAQKNWHLRSQNWEILTIFWEIWIFLDEKLTSLKQKIHYLDNFYWRFLARKRHPYKPNKWHFWHFSSTNSFDLQLLDEKQQILDWFRAFLNKNSRRRWGDPLKWLILRQLMFEKADFDEKMVKFFWFLLSLELHI